MKEFKDSRHASSSKQPLHRYPSSAEQNSCIESRNPLTPQRCPSCTEGRAHLECHNITDGRARTGGCRRRHIQVQVHKRNCMLLTTAGFEPKLLRCVGVSFLFLFQCLFLLCRSSSFLPS